MKISVSLSEADLAFVDEYARSRPQESRSGVIQQALALLRATQLGDSYAGAWEEWQSSPEGDLWDGTTGDGLGG